MNELDQQLLSLLARKAQLRDELDNIDRAVGQLTAIKQFAATQQPLSGPGETPPVPQPETPAEA